jgi:AcrR family transcriptional regulator
MLLPGLYRAGRPSKSSHRRSKRLTAYHTVWYYSSIPYGMELDDEMSKSKGDWLATGLKILGDRGVAGLTIQRMTDTLGVTKGSFYHHFANIDDFRELLVAYWADQYLSTAAGPPDGVGDGLALLDTIMEEAFSSVTEPEIAIRAWAHQDEMVQKAVEQVDRARRQFVLNVFRNVAGDEEQARLMADMLATMLIGSLTVLPRIPPQRAHHLYREFKRLYQLGE